jgi:membrane protein DedA with SNARE-associated domain
MIETFQAIIDWYMLHINYFTITLLMAVESSFIPFPSEIIIPPAAYKAAQGELNIYLVVLSASLGAMIGALFNYFLAMWLGRKVVYALADTRLAHMMLITRESVEKAEVYFQKHGRSSTLIGRLIPAIRQLISLPAGLARMNLKDFLIFTFIGSTIWNIVLAILGYAFWSQQELLHKYYHELSIGMLVLGVLFVGYLIYKGFSNKKPKNQVS